MHIYQLLKPPHMAVLNTERVYPIGARNLFQPFRRSIGRTFTRECSNPDMTKA